MSKVSKKTNFTRQPRLNAPAAVGGPGPGRHARAGDTPKSPVSSDSSWIVSTNYRRAIPARPLMPKHLARGRPGRPAGTIRAIAAHRRRLIGARCGRVAPDGLHARTSGSRGHGCDRCSRRGRRRAATACLRRINADHGRGAADEQHRKNLQHDKPPSMRSAAEFRLGDRATPSSCALKRRASALRARGGKAKRRQITGPAAGRLQDRSRTHWPALKTTRNAQHQTLREREAEREIKSRATETQRRGREAVPCRIRLPMHGTKGGQTCRAARRQRNWPLTRRSPRRSPSERCPAPSKSDGNTPCHVSLLRSTCRRGSRRRPRSSPRPETNRFQPSRRNRPIRKAVRRRRQLWLRPPDGRKTASSGRWRTRRPCWACRPTQPGESSPKLRRPNIVCERKTWPTRYQVHQGRAQYLIGGAGGGTCMILR